MDENNVPGVFTFYVNGTEPDMSGTYNIHNTIPGGQTMHLRNVMVSFAADTDAFDAKCIYFDASFLNSNLLLDGLPNLYLLPIPLQNNKMTQYSCDIPIAINTDIREAFNFRIVTSAGVVPTNIKSVFLQFALEKSVL